MNNITKDITLSTIKSDITHMEDIITDHSSADWEVKDGGLYCNNIFIGDGTEENANLALFTETETKTGTFCYAFIKTNDDALGWFGDNDTGYEEGHYERVAGTTLGPNGESLIGTYISKDVADALDADGEYSGEANVAGSSVYCYYKALYNKAGEIVGAIVVGRSMEDMKQLVRNASTSMFVIIIIIILLTGIAMILITHKWIKSVNKTQAYLKRIGDGELPDDPLVLNSRDEISDVAVSVNDMVKSLKEKKRIGAELNTAKDIQANLLPKTFPAFPERNDFDLYASMTPAKEVAGDFYDFFMTNDNKLVVVIADVSGKGIPAALFMATTRTLIKDHANEDLTSSEVLTKTNALLCEGNPYGFFVTAWLGIIDLETGEIDFTNAGHNPPLILKNGEFTYLKTKPNFVLAGMNGIIYKNEHSKLEKGDILFLYTDGVTEATDANDNLYGEERLLSYLSENYKDFSMQEICEGLKKDVDEFVGDVEQFDDITMLALKYSGGGIAHYEKSCVASVSNIETLTNFVNERLEKHNIPMKTVTQLNVAMDEILSNIAFYAYHGSTGSVRMVIEVPADEKKVVLKFVDGGMPYNPLEKEDPDVTLSAEERKIGGLGIFIVKKTMDKVDYEFKNGKNILTLTKYV